MGNGAIIIGIIFMIFGVFLILITKFNIVGVIYGIIAIAIGIALLIFNKEEEKVEQRKDLTKSRSLNPKK